MDIVRGMDQKITLIFLADVHMCQLKEQSWCVMINKKGMTLIELLVCVTLVSGIMAFMYKLISDVRNQKKNIDNLNDIYLKIED